MNIGNIIKKTNSDDITLNVFELNKHVFNTFAIFLIRDHEFTIEQANKEVALIEASMSDSYDVRDYTIKHYIKLSRVGQTKSLNRGKRMSIFLSFSNAINHAMCIINK